MPPKRHSPQKKACDVCYRRKIQCSFPSPGGPCDWCTYRNLACTFGREKPARNRPRSLESSNTSSLHRRIEQLEAALAQTRSTQEPITPSTSNTNTPQNPTTEDIPECNTNAGVSDPLNSSEEIPIDAGHPPIEKAAEITVSANQLGPNWFFNGISISSDAGRQWISSRTNQKVTESDFFLSITQPSPLAALEPLQSQDPFELPGESLAKTMLETFFDQSANLVLPILDEHLFERTRNTAYESRGSVLFSTSHLSARACVFGALSLATLMRGKPTHGIDGEVCAAKAHNLLMYLTGDMSLTTLQTVLSLQLIRIFNGHWQGAAFFYSIACRIVCSLGGHVYQPPQPVGPETSNADREIRHIRSLFWICYMIDKDISIRTGSPPILKDFDCDLTPPDPILGHFAQITESDDIARTMQKPPIPQLFADPRLSLLKEKIYRQLFSTRALKEDDNQTLLHIRHLDEEIEDWRLSIPTTSRPVLSVSITTSRPISTLPIPNLLQQMSLQLEYHHLMTIIHTTVRRCTADAPDRIRDLHDVVHSSFDLSLEASRSTLWCLRVLIDRIGGDAFGFITLYSTTATLSLFLNIIIHPYDPQARIDLEALMSAANTIRGMSVHCLKQREVALIHEISDFITRLVWLGTCAVTKIGRDKR